MSATLTQILLVAGGGAFGSVCRFLTASSVQRLTNTDYPYGTLSVNVVGSLVMGLLYVILVERSSMSMEWRALLLIGVLGGFTTFSSFSIETMNLLEQALWGKAFTNIVASVGICLLVTWLGMKIGRWL
jgi:fluoride exporter